MKTQQLFTTHSVLFRRLATSASAQLRPLQELSRKPMTLIPTRRQCWPRPPQPPHLRGRHAANRFRIIGRALGVPPGTLLAVRRRDPLPTLSQRINVRAPRRVAPLQRPQIAHALAPRRRLGRRQRSSRKLTSRVKNLGPLAVWNGTQIPPRTSQAPPPRLHSLCS